ncbi:MAG: hypothetical protein WD649_05305 [Thermoleophilaceae bacterium]
MSAPAISLAFFDHEHELHGMARAGTTLLFEGATPSALGEETQIEPDGEGWRARAEGHFELSFTPSSEPVELGPVRLRVCAVSGSVGEVEVSCLGTAGATVEAPSWEELDALRALSALFDPGSAVLALASRPRGAHGHGEELVTAGLVREGETVAVEEARLSTVYDGDGRQRTAGLELWLPGEDFPRRLSGSVAAGSSLELESLIVNAAVFRWRMDGREGLGEYNLTARNEPPAAA